MDDDQLRVLAATGVKRSAPSIRKRAKNLGIVLAGSTKAPGQMAKGE